jgi:hypothetical protein
MYTMDSDKQPKRPVVTTQAAALNEIRNWVRDNQFESLIDADGLDWVLDLGVTQVAAKDDPKGLVWQIRLGLKRILTAPELLKNGILRLPEDQRLLDLLGDEEISLTMKPHLHEVANELESKRLLADLLPRFKADLAKKSLLEVKRQLVGRWVDERALFGSAVTLRDQGIT